VAHATLNAQQSSSRSPTNTAHLGHPLFLHKEAARVPDHEAQESAPHSSAQQQLPRSVKDAREQQQQKDMAGHTTTPASTNVTLGEQATLAAAEDTVQRMGLPAVGALLSMAQSRSSSSSSSTSGKGSNSSMGDKIAVSSRGLRGQYVRTPRWEDALSAAAVDSVVKLHEEWVVKHAAQKRLHDAPGSNATGSQWQGDLHTQEQSGRGSTDAGQMQDGGVGVEQEQGMGLGTEPVKCSELGCDRKEEGMGSKGETSKVREEGKDANVEQELRAVVSPCLIPPPVDMQTILELSGVLRDKVQCT